MAISKYYYFCTILFTAVNHLMTNHKSVLRALGSLLICHVYLTRSANFITNSIEINIA